MRRGQRNADRRQPCADGRAQFDRWRNRGEAAGQTMAVETVGRALVPFGRRFGVVGDKPCLVRIRNTDRIIENRVLRSRRECRTVQGQDRALKNQQKSQQNRNAALPSTHFLPIHRARHPIKAEDAGALGEVRSLRRRFYRPCSERRSKGAAARTSDAACARARRVRRQDRSERPTRSRCLQSLPKPKSTKKPPPAGSASGEKAKIRPARLASSR